MTTIVLAHPSERWPRFRVFGVYDGEDDRFVFGVRDFEKRMMEFYKADHFERSVG